MEDKHVSFNLNNNLNFLREKYRRKSLNCVQIYKTKQMLQLHEISNNSNTICNLKNTQREFQEN